MDHIELATTAGRMRVPALEHEAAARLCITCHWAASSYVITDELLRHYHFVLDADGRVYAGVPIERNLRAPGGAMPDGYAAHVKGANSNNIGLAVAAMAHATESEARQGRYGPYPMTKAQAEGLVEVAAQLCAYYGIPVLPTRVLGHEEWDSVLGRPQDRWDVNCLPHLDIRPRFNADGTYASTNQLRQLTAARVAELQAQAEPGAQAGQLAVFRKFVAFMDAAEAAHFPAATLRLIKQLRDAPPLGSFTREDLEGQDE
jgi:N-acetyl-anhydromuramyl-L-alanine amidase AmpD